MVWKDGTGEESGFAAKLRLSPPAEFRFSLVRAPPCFGI